ncbi:MAG: AIR synthase related protein, partial [Pelagibacteraceae bacterium]
MNIESKIIHYLSQKHHKIGDDCAYLSDTKQLITTDSLLEGVHFDLKYFTDRQIAHRIFLSNYSDILSSGGIPKYALLSVNTPKNKHKRVFNIIKQLEIYLKKYQIELIGGDTTSSKNDINFSLTLLSKQIEKRSILKRSSAKINDNIYTFENIGYSKLGYLSIYKKLKISSKIKDLSQKKFLDAHVYSYHSAFRHV